MRSRGPLALAAHAPALRPAFAASVALRLGLGIGANVAVFSLLDAALLRPLPYPDAERLLLAWEARPDRGWSRFWSPPRPIATGLPVIDADDGSVLLPPPRRLRAHHDFQRRPRAKRSAGTACSRWAG
jgi:hypothetical protein